VNKLILWDIDGTLLYSGGVAGDAMRAAMERVYGRPFVEERRTYAGKTDQQIIMETFAEREHHYPELADIARFQGGTLLDREPERARSLLDDAIALYRRIGMPAHVELTERMLEQR
jgi:phosphoglycolate phosphatase-like HAD superfamily hydrolase